MMEFRKKPVVIEATRWFKNGDHPQDAPTRGGTTQNGESWEGLVVRYFRHPNVPGQIPCGKCGQSMRDHGWIDTLEGGHIVCPGDWIITGVQGERYPCKPDIFAKTYDPAEASPSSVPEGYALVPVEPTDEMLSAGCKALGALYGQHGASVAYRSMLAASPTPPVSEDRKDDCNGQYDKRGLPALGSVVVSSGAGDAASSSKNCSLIDTLWGSNEVMSMNAELGLPMEQLVKLAKAINSALQEGKP